MAAESLGQPRKERIRLLGNGDYSIVSGNVSITVDQLTGARILSLKLGSYEFLTGPEVMRGNYGSTFWPSPQADWSWPPPAVLDSDPYTATSDNDTVTFVSGKDKRTGLQVTKEFFPGNDGQINLVYSMKNITDSVRRVAPWEITRVRKGGLLFFPVGDNPTGRKSFDAAPVKVVDGIAWYKDAGKRPSKNLLTTADGTEGWAAYVVGGKMFIKHFPNVVRSEIAPGEGEIAFYVSSVADYVEFEIQGKYQSLPPGGHSSWHVEWMVVDVPRQTEIDIGSPSLVEFARDLVKRARLHR